MIGPCVDEEKSSGSADSDVNRHEPPTFVSDAETTIIHRWPKTVNSITRNKNTVSAAFKIAAWVAAHGAIIPMYRSETSVLSRMLFALLASAFDVAVGGMMIVPYISALEIGGAAGSAASGKNVHMKMARGMLYAAIAYTIIAISDIIAITLNIHISLFLRDIAVAIMIAAYAASDLASRLTVGSTSPLQDFSVLRYAYFAFAAATLMVLPVVIPGKLLYTASIVAHFVVAIASFGTTLSLLNCPPYALIHVIGATLNCISTVFAVVSMYDQIFGVVSWVLFAHASVAFAFPLLENSDKLVGSFTVV